MSDDTPGVADSPTAGQTRTADAERESTTEPDWSTGHWRVTGTRVLEVGGPDTPVREARIHLVGGHVDVVAEEDPELPGAAKVEVTRRSGVPVEVRLADGVLTVGHPSVRWDSALDRLRSWLSEEDAADIALALPADTPVRVTTVTADALVSGSRAQVTATSVTGDVALDRVGAPAADASARTVTGAIEVREPAGELSSESVSGSITVRGSRVPRLRCRTVSGDVAADLGGGPSTVDASTVSGRVTVRVPTGTGYEVRAQSFSGRVVAGAERLAGSELGSVDGRLSSGDPDVVLQAKTLSGDVTLLVGEPEQG